MIEKLRSLLSRKDKKFLLSLLFFSIIISLVETAGISVIMPFIAVATDFNLIETNQYYAYIYQLFEFEKKTTFVIFFGLLLIFFYIFRSGINLLYFYLLNKFTQGMYHILAYRLFRNYMGMSYGNFITRNSSHLTKSIISEAVYLSMLISAIVFMLSEVFIALFIYIMMIYVDYKITFFLTVILGVSSLLILKIISVRIKQAGVLREEAHKVFYEIVNRSFGNFKLIKLQSQDRDIVNDFGAASSAFARANINNDTLNQIPRLFLEAVGFGLIILIITYLVWIYEDDISTVLSLVSIFVLALYRLMPSVNRIMTSYNQILFTHKSLDIIYSDLIQDRERIGAEQVDFKKEITLNGLSFEYEKNSSVLENINLTIKKGLKVAFVGESGSGKSTLVDILIGLYFPNKGEMCVDGNLITTENIKSWRSKIGYIPQFVYLFDGTVGENIAFGLEYDREKVDRCLKKAKIYDFLQEKKGQDSLVGEGGVMLSGGQKQRVAIARALYSEPEILVLDEATSALDDETEKEIMDEIYDISRDKTLIIIAHRLSTIDRCEKVYRLSHGKLMK